METLKRAEKGRPGVSRECRPGEVVFVFRKPLPRKEGGESKEACFATCCGPGTVVMTEGANVRIAMPGEMWKCAKEQVRRAAPEEEEA